jgi:hypothetical protein
MFFTQKTLLLQRTKSAHFGVRAPQFGNLWCRDTVLRSVKICLTFSNLKHSDRHEVIIMHLFNTFCAKNTYMSFMLTPDTLQTIHSTHCIGYRFNNKLLITTPNPTSADKLIHRRTSPPDRCVRTRPPTYPYVYGKDG